jgi:hypothetical protein
MADGLERRAIYDQLSRPPRSTEEPGHRCADPHRAHRLPYSDDDRRFAGGDRHRGYGSCAPRQYHSQERQGRRSRGRRRHRDARQDRDDHRWRSSGARVHSAWRCVGGRAHAPGRACFRVRPDAGRQEHRRGLCRAREVESADRSAQRVRSLSPSPRSRA